jgi:hypothetical protein
MTLVTLGPRPQRRLRWSTAPIFGTYPPVTTGIKLPDQRKLHRGGPIGGPRLPFFRRPALAASHKNSIWPTLEPFPALWQCVARLLTRCGSTWRCTLKRLSASLYRKRDYRKALEIHSSRDGTPQCEAQLKTYHTALRQIVSSLLHIIKDKAIIGDKSTPRREERSLFGGGRSLGLLAVLHLSPAKPLSPSYGFGG